MNIHIALIGKAKEPVLKGFQHYPVDKLFILHSDDTALYPFAKTAAEVRNSLKGIGFQNVFLVPIDPFDMYSVINAIVRVAEQEDGSNFYVNITGGTNLMAGAACSASYFIGARAYYVLHEDRLPEGATIGDNVIELPMPRINSFRDLGRTQTMVLKEIASLGGTATSAQLWQGLEISPQKLSYSLKELEKSGLVTSTRGVLRIGRSKNTIDRRGLRVSLTQHGRLVATWAE